jgi:hypothetical protein
LLTCPARHAGGQPRIHLECEVERHAYALNHLLGRTGLRSDVHVYALKPWIRAVRLDQLLAVLRDRHTELRVLRRGACVSEAPRAHLRIEAQPDAWRAAWCRHDQLVQALELGEGIGVDEDAGAQCVGKLRAGLGWRVEDNPLGWNHAAGQLKLAERCCLEPQAPFAQPLQHSGQRIRLHGPGMQRARGKRLDHGAGASLDPGEIVEDDRRVVLGYQRARGSTRRSAPRAESARAS